MVGLSALVGTHTSKVVEEISTHGVWPLVLGKVTSDCFEQDHGHQEVGTAAEDAFDSAGDHSDEREDSTNDWKVGQSVGSTPAGDPCGTLTCSTAALSNIEVKAIGVEEVIGAVQGHTTEYNRAKGR